MYDGIRIKQPKPERRKAMKNVRKSRFGLILMAAAMIFTAEPAVTGMSQACGIPICMTMTAEAAVNYFPKCSQNYTSIVDALKSIGVDSSFSNRKKIAETNGISNYSGTASQNNSLLRLLKGGKLIRSVSSSNTQTSSATTNAGKKVYNTAASYLGKKYTYFKGKGFHDHAWCADFVSFCAKSAGQSKAIPWEASVTGIRTAIKKAGGKEYSKAAVQKKQYVPVKGDIIIFKSNGASHVGIVECISGGRIYYIDGNNITNGNGNRSCVHYSNCSTSDSRFTCVLKPKYR